MKKSFAQQSHKYFKPYADSENPAFLTFVKLSAGCTEYSEMKLIRSNESL